MKITSCLLFACASLAVLAPAAPARADKPPAVSEQDRPASERADALAHAANALAMQDRWAEAVPLYQAAWALKHSYDIGANLGIAEEALGRWRDAAEHISFGLRSFPANGKPEHRRLMEATLAKTLPHVAALTLHVSVDNVEILVDGKSAGFAPLADRVFVEPGAHTIEARRDGYDPASRSVQVAKGDAVEVDLAMVATPVPPVPEGKKSAPLASATGPSKPLIITGAVLAGAGVVMGTAFALLSNAKASDAAAGRATMVTMGATAACGATPSASCQAVESAGQARATFANASAWSFIAGGALGAATVIYALAAPRAAKASGTRVAPTLAAGGGGVVVRGEW